MPFPIESYKGGRVRITEHEWLPGSACHLSKDLDPRLWLYRRVSNPGWERTLLHLDGPLGTHMAHHPAKQRS